MHKQIPKHCGPPNTSTPPYTPINTSISTSLNNSPDINTPGVGSLPVDVYPSEKPINPTIISPPEKPINSADSANERAWKWFRGLGSPRHWLAPMVGQSGTAFRVLMRANGADICHTEMIDACGYAKSEKYRNLYPFHEEDRPLIVQFGGSNPETLNISAGLVAPYCDGVELNVGCPQRCARKQGYGSFLLDKPDLLIECVTAIATAVRKSNPRAGCLVKIRCKENIDDTIRIARMLERCGCMCLTVHGRTRGQGGGKRTGGNLANWDWIRDIKASLGIPVIANGNIREYSDIVACKGYTHADGVMAGVGAMHRVWIFDEDRENTITDKSDIVPLPGKFHSFLSRKKPTPRNALTLLNYSIKYLETVISYCSVTHPRAVAKHLTALFPSVSVRSVFDEIMAMVIKVGSLKTLTPLNITQLLDKYEVLKECLAKEETEERKA